MIRERVSLEEQQSAASALLHKVDNNFYILADKIRNARALGGKKKGEKITNADEYIYHLIDTLSAVLDLPEKETVTADEYENAINQRNRALKLLRRIIERTYLVRAEYIPGNLEKMIFIQSQKESLKTWEDCLFHSNAAQNYPMWFRVLVIKSILQMTNTIQKNHEFKKRKKPHKERATFPELNEDALSFVFESLQQKLSVSPDELEDAISFRPDITSEDRKYFISLGENAGLSSPVMNARH